MSLLSQSSLAVVFCPRWSRLWLRLDTTLQYGDPPEAQPCPCWASPAWLWCSVPGGAGSGWGRTRPGHASSVDPSQRWGSRSCFAVAPCCCCWSPPHPASNLRSSCLFHWAETEATMYFLEFKTTCSARYSSNQCCGSGSESGSGSSNHHAKIVR